MQREMLRDTYSFLVGFIFADLAMRVKIVNDTDLINQKQWAVYAYAKAAQSILKTLHIRVIGVDGMGGSIGNSIGVFRLRSTIDPDTGALQMERPIQVHGHRSRWVGSLTPFCIFTSQAGGIEGWGSWI